MPYVDITIRYRGQEVTFRNCEFDDECWYDDNSINFETVQDDFMDYCELEVSNIHYNTPTVDYPGYDRLTVDSGIEADIERRHRDD